MESESSQERSNKNKYSSKQQDVVQLSIFGDDEPGVGTKPDTVVAVDKPTRDFIRNMKDIDVMNMTPLQAMQLLNELKLKAQQLS
jgi:DNA mismatch repair protein MutS